MTTWCPRSSRRPAPMCAACPMPGAASLHWLRRQGRPERAVTGDEAASRVCATRPCPRSDHRRVGARERLLQAAAAHPGRLHIELDALATRVLFDSDGAASGVEYLKGQRLYRAHATPSDAPAERREVHARREVILCGGAFNTPQLLMLSGHRSGGRIARARNSRPRRPAGRRAQSAGPLRGRRDPPHAPPLASAGRGALRARRSAVAKLERPARGHVCLQRRGDRPGSPLRSRRCRSRTSSAWHCRRSSRATTAASRSRSADTPTA